MSTMKYINIADLNVPEFEAHQQIDIKKLQEISESIKTVGVLEPLLIRKKNKQFEIVAGCIRYNAAKIAGLKSVPCIILSLKDEQAEIIKLHENVKRIDLDHVDQGNTFVMMRDRFKMTEETIAINTGKSISFISNHIALVTQDKILMNSVKCGDISFSQSRELLSVKDIDQRRIFQGYCQRNGASVTVLKSWIKEWKDSLADAPRPVTFGTK